MCYTRRFKSWSDDRVGKNSSLPRDAVPVLYCHFRFDPPRTGGEWVHCHVFDSLASQPDIDLQGLGTDGLSALRRRGLETQQWFVKRFWHLSTDTIIVQACESYQQLCLANWVLRLRPHRPRILMMVNSQPYLAGMNWRGVLVEGFWFRVFICSADRLVTNSHYMGNRVVELGARRGKVVVNPPAAQELPLAKGMGEPLDVIQIIYPAHIRPFKGQEVLIEAVRRIEDERVTVVLAGLVKDREYDQRLRSLVKQYGLGERVKFAGYLHGQEMADAYASSSICVFPTMHEGYGMVVQEARQFGLPVIASSVGGVSEQIEDGVDGLLVPPGDPDALADAIRRVVDDAGFRERLIENGYRRLETAPTWEQVGERFYQVIRQMAGMAV